jgi:hypothetical protein
MNNSLDFSLILALAGVGASSKVGELFLFENENHTTKMNSCRSHQLKRILENHTFENLIHTTETKINPCKTKSNHNYKIELAHLAEMKSDTIENKGTLASKVTVEV